MDSSSSEEDAEMYLESDESRSEHFEKNLYVQDVEKTIGTPN